MINAGIVGLGRWGQNLVNSIQGKSDKIRVVAGTTRTLRSRTPSITPRSRVFRCSIPSTKLLADPKIDAVVIVATPHTQRVELITAAAKAGKHVFTEKPLTLTSDDAARLHQGLRDHKVTLAVGYNWRFQPALQEIRRMLDDGRLGKLLHIEGNFCGPSVYRFGREHWRLQSRRRPGRRHDRPRRARGRRDDVSVRPDRHACTRRATAARSITASTTRLRCCFVSGTARPATSAPSSPPPKPGACRCSAPRAGPRSATCEHLTTWEMRVCFVDPDNLNVHHKPQIDHLPADQHRARRTRKLRRCDQGQASAGGRRRRRDARRGGARSRDEVSGSRTGDD